MKTIALVFITVSFIVSVTFSLGYLVIKTGNALSRYAEALNETARLAEVAAPYQIPR